MGNTCTYQQIKKIYVAHNEKKNGRYKICILKTIKSTSLYEMKLLRFDKYLREIKNETKNKKKNHNKMKSNTKLCEIKNRTKNMSFFSLDFFFKLKT